MKLYIKPQLAAVVIALVAGAALPSTAFAYSCSMDVANRGSSKAEFSTGLMKYRGFKSSVKRVGKRARAKAPSGGFIDIRANGKITGGARGKHDCDVNKIIDAIGN